MFRHDGGRPTAHVGANGDSRDGVGRGFAIGKSGVGGAEAGDRQVDDASRSAAQDGAEALVAGSADTGKRSDDVDARGPAALVTATDDDGGEAGRRVIGHLRDDAFGAGRIERRGPVVHQHFEVTELFGQREVGGFDGRCGA